jgi:hypothetical protein
MHTALARAVGVAVSVSRLLSPRELARERERETERGAQTPPKGQRLLTAPQGPQAPGGEERALTSTTPAAGHLVDQEEGQSPN